MGYGFQQNPNSTVGSSVLTASNAFRMTLYYQLDRIGQVASQPSQSLQTLAIQFNLSVLILKAYMAPYFDEKFKKEYAELTSQPKASDPNSIIQYSMSLLVLLIELMDRMNLLLPFFTVEDIAFDRKENTVIVDEPTEE